MVKDFYLTSQWSKELHICSGDSFISHSFSSSSLMPSSSSSDGDDDDGKSETSAEDSYC